MQKAEESKEKYDALQKEADENKKHYKDKIKDLETREKQCKETESNIETRLQQVKEKEAAFTNKEAELLKSFQDKQDKWEEERKEIEQNLNEKIKEYDRKMADIEAMGETIDNIKFDDSEDGKKAKIVVKEALRASMQTLEDTLHKFRELDEKYASGTFKGFSIPIDEISNTNEELKSYYESIRENAEASGFDFSVWLKKIEDSIIEADKQYKSHLFAESYRACIRGLSYCDGYADMIDIFNSYTGSDEAYAEDEDSSWCNYYEFFFEEDYDDDMDYTSVRFSELKKQHRKMAKKYHPDTAPEDKRKKYEEIMKKLNEIWEILKDEQRRKEYDDTYHEEKGKK
ncbi:MAG: DnaJ domain-containing protein [Helicobacter sp.]|uniref:J domain-containing protein n=1 Tax=Helicobacter sp. TaxID=218 RepID=UPI002A91063A|nr:DnaJ domain-containing protein [Helicobacter sp.]MDY5951019.1 DnaJ domain-containing protein [Helicobacter sp.]